MEKREYSEQEIVEVVKSFKVFIKKVVRHSAIDYARKVKASKYREVVFNDLVASKTSLSVVDDDVFFCEQRVDYRRIENVMSSEIHKKAISILTEREKKILYLTSEKYPPAVIAKIMKTSVDCIYSTRNNIKRKITKKIGELENGK